MTTATSPKATSAPVATINAPSPMGKKMPLEGSYVVWNNRGGSGKTNLTYHLAIKYAYRNPDKTVLVVDMCPQADLSHAFLGDDEDGHDYVSQIGSLKKDPMILDGQQRIPRTISGYLDIYTSVGLPNNVDPRTFLFNVSKFNNQLPRNVYLLCGDTSLELLGKAMDLKRSSHTITPYANPWRTITQSLRAFVHKIGERRGIKLMTFIDTNSSFSICTEIALTAADRLILPVSEDHLHRNGFEYLFSLLYGFSQPSSIYYYYRHYSFYYRADENSVKLPKIHLILCKVGSSSTESKIGIGGNVPTPGEIDKCWRFVYDTYTKHRDAFEIRTSSILATSPSHEKTYTTAPRLSSISLTPSLIHEQHPSSLPGSLTPSAASHCHNHINKLNNQTPPYQIQTFEEFMRQYVMHIGNEANVVSRIAVISHSPLLAVKHPHHSHEYQICAQTFDKTLNDIVERI
ncbi:unnamed protein product [Rotaria socialis]|uniref:CobQ/CobB/MinD/ParA nucleotide binding domain-containing protein n=3 Tax=Rotaria socialis TaxID=392032 RepID=A0A818CVS6_9BILA|nr:unnamed protein product [Rotaria socialis]CAF3432290.1 unnamed protein product [Rotaria socialis]CAF3438134.1 unnamed protein product [Rotaria socialis]CAF3739275.1 unnamed protein product [Rotaria socialis]CAF3758421.1 unnamed protein product [Rotaria socialis]